MLRIVVKEERSPQALVARTGRSTPPAVVVEYNPRWREDFQTLRAWIEPLVAGVAMSIEHVGSTAVPGLAAKPIIDLDVVVPDEAASRAAVVILARAGWQSQGDLGIADREAFAARPGLPYHHLYVVIADSSAYLDHFLLRDHLRRHPEAAAEYGALKKRLAFLLHQQRQAYADGKAELIERLLSAEREAREPEHR